LSVTFPVTFIDWANDVEANSKNIRHKAKILLTFIGLIVKR